MAKTETNCVHIDFINMMLKVRLMCFKIYLDLKDGLYGPVSVRLSPASPCGTAHEVHIIVHTGTSDRIIFLISLSKLL